MNKGLCTEARDETSLMAAVANGALSADLQPAAVARLLELTGTGDKRAFASARLLLDKMILQGVLSADALLTLPPFLAGDDPRGEIKKLDLDLRRVLIRRPRSRRRR